jgi:hypothetical protein
MHTVMVTHLGVGDGIIQSGLAIALLDRYELIAFPAYQEYLTTFQSIFAAHPRIFVYPVPRIKGEDYGSPHEQTYNKAIIAAGLNPACKIKLGVYSGLGIGWDFTKSFYLHASIDYSMRWKACPIAQAFGSVSQIIIESLNGQRRIFLHDDSSRGFIIRRRHVSHSGQVFSPSGSLDQSILRYASPLINADEIHCIDSAFFWLADHLPVKGQLFLHRYARWPRPRDFRYETFRHWNYID